ncbi:MAG: bifunctional isocitrate dehydrogenase kinase/phosphatase [Bacteroidota bacterium]
MEEQVLTLIYEGFHTFLGRFHQLSAQARDRFEARDWAGIQSDSRRRISLYKSQVATLVRKVKRLMREDASNLGAWYSLRTQYEECIQNDPALELAETFYNSICRKVIGKMGAHKDLMFVSHTLQKNPDPHLIASLLHVFPLSQDLKGVIRSILQTYAFTQPYEDIERDVSFIVARITQQYSLALGDRLEILKPVFFRNKGAYIIGRLVKDDQNIPFILPLLHQESGIFVDSLILDSDTCSIIFSFARSYFMVEVEHPSALIHFLSTIMPIKKWGDLYNSIGFYKHGKTVFYRNLMEHLSNATDQFTFAPGIPGLVMAVFTLPSYPIVFKLIKDKIEPPKQTTRGEVRGKYRLVKMIDRVGRMADTHEFEHLEFEWKHFTPELLSYLLEVAPSIVRVKEGKVVIDHVYTERKMRPLNLFLHDCRPEDLEEVVGEYGNAIKEMAAANIFPGDMFLKNFGVTRHNRVIFYDYDEIGYLTDYNFREMPKAESAEDIYADTPWFGIGPNDVFPDEFRHFLVGRENMEKIFTELHSDLFTVAFWKHMQERQRRGEIVEVYPYRRKMRFQDR